MTGNYDDIPYPPDYGALRAMTTTPTPALDLDALEAIAKAATPGPHLDGKVRATKAAFAKTFDAPTVLTLIERARQAEKLDLVMEAFERASESLDNQDDQIASLRTQLSAANARADKAEQEVETQRGYVMNEREDWVQSNVCVNGLSAELEAAKAECNKLEWRCEFCGRDQPNYALDVTHQKHSSFQLFTAAF